LTHAPLRRKIPLHRISHVRPKAFYVDADKVYGKMGNRVSMLRALVSAFRL
jgi:predicted RNA-binding protein YlqC (UPF0109 family)